MAPATLPLLLFGTTYLLLAIGSVANLIVVEQAERCGIRIGFRDHLRVGLPVTLVSLAAAIAMLAWLAK